MEINPSTRSPAATLNEQLTVRPLWMFDQIEAASELDFVNSLRAVSDEFAAAKKRTLDRLREHFGLPQSPGSWQMHLPSQKQKNKRNMSFEIAHSKMIQN